MHRKTILVAAVVFTWAAVFCTAAAYELANPAVAVRVKMAASTGYLLIALAAGALRSRYGIAMLLGLMCSWWGDLFLSFGGWGFFLAGLIAYLLGHAGFSCAYIIHRTRIRRSAICLAAFLLPAFLLGRWFWPGIPEHLRLPTAAYIIVITCMVALACGTLQRPGGWLIVLGATAFFISDICVAHIYFINVTPVIAATALLLYYGGQTMLAGTIAIVNRSRDQA